MSRFERSLQTGRELRAPLRGREFWRSLEELAGDQAFQERVAQEFPHAQEAWSDPISRRRFLMLMGASLSLAGLTGCPAPAPQQTILPYVRNPDGIVPGQPLYYATAMPQGGFGLGVLVESHEGRPTKIEGNPDHPACPRPVDAPQSLPLRTDQRLRPSVDPGAVRSGPIPQRDPPGGDQLVGRISDCARRGVAVAPGRRSAARADRDRHLADPRSRDKSGAPPALPRRAGTCTNRPGVTTFAKGPGSRSAKSSSRSITSIAPT